jgi:hypothetical protein
MWKVKKSSLFIRQWKHFALDYKERAGIEIAGRFIDSVEQALDFISQNPLSCSPYSPGADYEDLLKYEFRKWTLKKFPHSIFLRTMNNNTIIIETICAHKMDIIGRFPKDVS